jgi:DNA-3-methyladenine glycosylase II
MNYAVAIDTLKQADPILAELIEQVGECKLNQVQQTGDLFSSLCRSIIYQQLSGKAATAIHQRFLQLYTLHCFNPQRYSQHPRRCFARSWHFSS